MSISRRQFLLSTTVTGAGLVLPNTFDRLFDHLEKTGEPLLEKPKRQVAILNAVDGYDGFQLNLGDPFEDPGPITLREYLSDYVCMKFDEYLEEIKDWKEGPVQVSLEDKAPGEIGLIHGVIQKARAQRRIVFSKTLTSVRNLRAQILPVRSNSSMAHARGVITSLSMQLAPCPLASSNKD